jgi:hypothetical protein
MIFSLRNILGWPIYSASSLSTAQCTVKSLQGTSMASPAAAGNAVLIQEYFTNGHYPSGIKNEADKFIPSGALIKAVLIHSGKKISKRVFPNNTYANLNNYPSTTQGYGRVTIGNVLNFGKSESKYLSLFVRGSASKSEKYYVYLNGTGDKDHYDFETSGKTVQSDIRITVTFTDVLSAFNAATAGVHSLSMTALNLNTSTSYSSLVAGSTQKNNVAMIEIINPPPNSTFRVTVRADLVTGIQPYAIVISGSIVKFEDTANYTSSDLDINHSSIGITKSVMTAIIVLGSACLFLFVSIILIRTENAKLERQLEWVRRSNDPNGFATEPPSPTA